MPGVVGITSVPTYNTAKRGDIRRVNGPVIFVRVPPKLTTQNIVDFAKISLNAVLGVFHSVVPVAWIFFRCDESFQQACGYRYFFCYGWVDEGPSDESPFRVIAFVIFLQKHKIFQRAVNAIKGRLN